MFVGKKVIGIRCCASTFCIAGAAMLLGSSGVQGEEQDWPVPESSLVFSDDEALPDVPTTSFVVPAPDGALAGLSVLTGLAVAYGIRHHRARRAG